MKQRITVNLLLLSLMSLLSACASLVPSDEKLETEKSCRVWKEGMFGTKNIVQFNGPQAYYEHSCGVFGCSKVLAYYKEDQNIYTANSGLVKLETKVGAIKNDEFIFAQGDMIKSTPLALKDKKISYELEALGRKTQHKISRNDSCDKKQVALGAALLISK